MGFIKGRLSGCGREGVCWVVGLIGRKFFVSIKLVEKFYFFFKV